ncbi:MAG: PilZ domain-containing protein [Phycisphaeraceae bacterium]|jgi:hypothetical protein|nr:PilZ domain-containing protein [Phycisphaeraceae bacterium]MDP7347016.1 PilZ domain-containing protein [Phycisphaeraceae bacterium]
MEQTKMQAQSTAPLQLIRPGDKPADVYRLERRVDARFTLNERITAVQAHRDERGRKHRICSLQLMNMSDGGLCAKITEPIELGTTLTMFFPAHGPERGFDRYGQVVRCRRHGWGYEIGVTLAGRAAA